jgi:hypothetical protein
VSGGRTAFKARFERDCVNTTAHIEIRDTRGGRHPPSEDLERMGQVVPTQLAQHRI